MSLVSVILSIRGNKVLAVSRPDNPFLFALPGGNVEQGETPVQAAARELFEETGLMATDLFPVYEGIERGNHVITYYAPSVYGKLKSSTEGEAAWVSHYSVICGAFPKYTKSLYRSFGLDVPVCQ